jgi:hypothetical protein
MLADEFNMLDGEAIGELDDSDYAAANENEADRLIRFLLAHGNEHGVVLRPDGTLAVLELWTKYHEDESLFTLSPDGGIPTSDAPVEPQPEARPRLSADWRARFRQLVTMAYAFAEHMEETDRYDADWFNSVTRPIDRLVEAQPEEGEENPNASE